VVCNVGWKLKTSLASFGYQYATLTLEAVSGLLRAIEGILRFWGMGKVIDNFSWGYKSDRVTAGKTANAHRQGAGMYIGVRQWERIQARVRVNI